jgi:segregation and condensation protein A
MTSSIEEGSNYLNLQELVKNATWRELLVELVESNKLDPWDIDIIKVVDSYVDAVKKMKVMDLHIPANIILAASILLRMKSETINILQTEEVLESEEAIQTNRIMPEVPNLVPRLRLQPKRKITLNELMDALGDAIKVNEKREIITKQRAAPINMVIENDNIDEKIEKVFNLINESVDKEGLTTFAALSKGFETIENILLKLFVPLLFLAHRGNVVLMQDQFFDEIFVKLNDDKDGGKKE